MMKTVSTIAFALAAFCLATPSASAMSQSEIRACNTMAASFKPQKAAFEAKTAERDALAIKAEEAGETWENAEAVSAFGTEKAALAEEARISYDAARTEFETVQAEWQTLGVKLNEDFASFNQKCAKD